MSLMKCYWILQNAIVTDLTFSELLRENQQGGKSHLVFEEDLTLWWIQLRNKNKITNIEPVVLRYSAKKQYWNVWSCCKSTGLQLYWKKHKCFSVKFAKIYRSSFSAEHLPVIASKFFIVLLLVNWNVQRKTLLRNVLRCQRNENKTHKSQHLRD